MIFPTILIIFLAAVKPEPFLIQSAIDSARLIDRLFAKKIWINEMEDELIYISYSRIDFIKNYAKIKSFPS
jgi:hypothetical protein